VGEVSSGVEDARRIVLPGGSWFWQPEDISGQFVHLKLSESWVLVAHAYNLSCLRS
jgi:hypothetical protein